MPQDRTGRKYDSWSRTDQFVDDMDTAIVRSIYWSLGAGLVLVVLFVIWLSLAA